MLNFPVDVGISRGIPGRPRRDSQKIWLLDAVGWFSLSRSVVTILSLIIPTTLVLRSEYMHTSFLGGTAHTIVYTA